MENGGEERCGKRKKKGEGSNKDGVKWVRTAHRNCRYSSICQHFVFLFGGKRELGGLKDSHRRKSKGAAKKKKVGPPAPL